MTDENPNQVTGLSTHKAQKQHQHPQTRDLMAGKKIKGRKRHIVTDTMGNLLAIKVHAANIHDTKSGIGPAKKAYVKYPTILKFCGDEGYRKSFEEAVSGELKLDVDISKRIKPEFEVIPLRWKVERTFGWANNSRRLSKDYEIKVDHEENILRAYPRIRKI